MNLGVAQQLVQGVKFIGLEIKNILDPGVHQDLEAVDAGSVGDVDCRLFDVRAVFGRLRDGVHFGMDGSKAILFGVSVWSFGFVY